MRDRGVRVTFAGTPDWAEAQLVPAAGFAFDTFRVLGFPRAFGVTLVRALGVAATAPFACAAILRRRRPDVVLGAGGFVAGPMVLAARLLGIPAVLTEADAHLGLANRLAAPFARRVLLSYPIPGREGERYRVAGRPLPRSSRLADRLQARSSFGLPEQGTVVLVIGARAGARRLNEAALEAFGSDGPAVLHLAGEREQPALAGRTLRPGYVLLAATEGLGAALAAADLVVSRAGGSVWEIAAAGKPAILVPYPYATAGHQLKNARYFERGGGAVVVSEQQLDLRSEVELLLVDPQRLQRMGEAMLRLARPDAADIVAEELIALARE